MGSIIILVTIDNNGVCRGSERTQQKLVRPKTEQAFATDSSLVKQVTHTPPSLVIGLREKPGNMKKDQEVPRFPLACFDQPLSPSSTENPTGWEFWFVFLVLDVTIYMKKMAQF